jgi:hypothetical protein
MGRPITPFPSNYKTAISDCYLRLTELVISDEGGEVHDERHFMLSVTLLPLIPGGSSFKLRKEVHPFQN